VQKVDILPGAGPHVLNDVGLSDFALSPHSTSTLAVASLAKKKYALSISIFSYISSIKTYEEL
jgi:hypothetical protein